MKVKLNKDHLLNGLQLVQNIVGSRTTLPILSNVLIQVAESSLQLTTTDLDISVRCKIPAEISRPGAVTLPVRRFSSVVRELPAAEVFLEADGKNFVTGRCGATFFKMHGLPIDEFPALAKVEKAKRVGIEQSALKEILRRTTYAISTDETRFVLNGLFLSFKSNKLIAVATDGRRLALVETEVELPKESEQEIIVPAKAVSELTRLLGDTGRVELQMTDNHVAFEFSQPRPGKKTMPGEGSTAELVNEGVVLISKLIVGAFPNYRQVIPAETKERVTLEREAFLSALHRVSLLTTEKSSAVKLAFTKNQLSISANSPEIGEANETLAVHYQGKELAIAFNPLYLMDPLRNLDTDEVFLELSDELSPGMVKINGPFLYVVMPLRLN